jgi:hypothetical protein
MIINRTVSNIVNNPPHYTYSSIEPIEIIEAWELNFHLGNVIKYVCRATKKNGLEDLKKARWYLNRYIEKIERENSK